MKGESNGDGRRTAAWVEEAADMDAGKAGGTMDEDMRVGTMEDRE